MVVTHCGLDRTAHVVSSYHMGSIGTLKRTSMSLDDETLNALDSLAAKWETSKSEVIRRAVRKSKLEEDSKAAPKSPVEAIRWLRKHGLTKKESEAFKEEIRLERNAKRYWWE